MPKSLLIFLFLSLSVFSQKTITGVVSDTLNQPLESANLIAKPLQDKAKAKKTEQKMNHDKKYFSTFKNVQNKNTILPLQNFF